MPEIVARPYVESDLEGVLDLLRAALGETPTLRRTPELFAWKHFRNPFGRSIMMVAEDRGRIVGLRAFMRWDLEHPTGTLRCVRAVDTATHPEYQRRGIFRLLTTAAVDQARGDGIDMIFNTPNPQSGAGYLSMGWSQVSDLGVMVRPLRGIRSRGVEMESPPVVSDFVDEEPLQKVPDIECRTSARLRTPRTAEYLEWRLVHHPTARYVAGLSGSTTVIARPNMRSGRRELVVSDIFGEADGRSVGRWLRKSRAAYAAGWFSKKTPERRAAIRGGLMPVPRVKSLTLVARPLRSLPMDVSDIGEWDLAISDLELL